MTAVGSVAMVIFLFSHVCVSVYKVLIYVHIGVVVLQSVQTLTQPEVQFL